MNTAFMLPGRGEECGECAHLARKEWVHLWVRNRNHMASAGTQGNGEIPSHRTEVDKETAMRLSTQRRSHQRTKRFGRDLTMD